MLKLPHNCTIPHASKVMLKILQARLQQYVNRELPDVQAGFRKGRRTRDQIANICWIIEKAREFPKSIYFCFIDYAKDFDCVDYNELWKILKEMGIPDHLTSLLRSLYADQEATVRTGHGTTDWFQIGKGVSQGWNSSWAISNPKSWWCESAALNMPANLENSAAATGLEKVSFHSNPKERQCQRMFKLLHNCIHLTC